MKYQPIIGTQMSGSLGGVTASHNTYGSYFRKRVSPVNPDTSAQAAQRTAFGDASQAWRGLTTAQQQAWITAAPSLPTVSKSGSSVILTGQALFMRSNIQALKAGNPLITVPPTTNTSPTITPPTITLNGSGLFKVTYNVDEWNAAGGSVNASTSATITNGRNYVGEYYALGISAFPNTTVQDYTSAFNVPTGGTVNVRFSATTPDGRKSQKLTVPVVATSADLTTVTSGLAGAATLTFSDDIRVTNGQFVGRDVSTGADLHAAGDQIGTVITVNEAIVIGNSVTENPPPAGVTKNTVGVIAT